MGNLDTDENDKKQLDYLSTIFNDDSLNWELRGDGVRAARLFVANYTGRKYNLKKYLFEEMQGFCKLHRLPIALSLAKTISFYTPNIKASQVDKLKDAFEKRIAKRNLIETSYQEQLRCLNKLTKFLVHTAWEFTINHQDGMPQAIFTLDVVHYDSEFIAALESELRELLNLKIEKTDNQIIIFDIDENLPKPSKFTETNDLLIKQFVPKTAESSVDINDNNSMNSPALLKEGKTSEVSSSVPPLIAASQEEILSILETDGRSITHNPKNEELSDKTAILLRNPLCKSLSIYAVLDSKIIEAINNGKLNKDEMDLITTLESGKMVGEYGTGIKDCNKETDGKFAYKVKHKHNPYRLFSEFLKKEPNKIVLNFVKFKKTH